jgi:hypothetical protein
MFQALCGFAFEIELLVSSRGALALSWHTRKLDKTRTTCSHDMMVLVLVLVPSSWHLSTSAGEEGGGEGRVGGQQVQ